MADTLNFELVSPEKLLLSGDAVEVTVPGSEGEFGVMPMHAPFISTLRPGILKVKMGDGAEHDIFVRGGFAEAGPEALTVLAEEAVPVADMDTSKLQQLIQDAEEDVRDATEGETRSKAEMHLAHLKDVEAVLARR
ncbi:F0F1 ATP synthase subunit epsilon [Tepidamorphus sp. 3E244]|uniref:F0F1 ATP synthase subunit epsilon n=1 Tax=Tepidamorphus sp. 3E244 TaxID=3385498 RepID=UPI0038FC0DB7